MRVRHMSYRSEQTYVGWVTRYVRFHAARAGRFVHPRDLREPDVEAFLNHLANDLDVAASTQTQALSALLFLYDAVLEQPLVTMHNLTRVRKPPRLPTVLSRAEVARVLGAMRGQNALIARLMYGSGLRLSGALNLRVKDVDLVRRQVDVHSGKGDRDRVTLLPLALVEPLRVQAEQVRALHLRDLAAGQGRARLPHGLARKLPTAATDLGWQFLFPAARLAVDPEMGWRSPRRSIKHCWLSSATRSAQREAA